MRRVSVDHELLRRAVADPEVLHWHTWAALAPGPSLVVLGAVQMFVLAMMGEYIGRLYSQSKNRPLYIVQDIAGEARAPRKGLGQVPKDATAHSDRPGGSGTLPINRAS